MDQNAWIMLFVGIALSAGLFALGVVLYPKLKREEQGYPLEAAIEAALLPVIFEGICAAYRVSEKGVDELHERIRGADKKKMADSIYRMLPDQVGNYDLSLIKSLVSEKRFENLRFIKTKTLFCSFENRAAISTIGRFRKNDIPDCSWGDC